MPSSKNWFPVKQAALLAYAQNFAGKINSAPTTYGCVAADGTALQTRYGAFETTMGVLDNPATKNEITTAQKDIAMGELIREMRRVYKKVQAAQLPADKLLELQVPIPDREPSPIPDPQTPPVLTLLATLNRTMRVRVADLLTPGKRSKPEGVTAYEIYSYRGELLNGAPPADLSLWTFVGLKTRSEFVLTVEESAAAGMRIFIAARWVNAKGGAGPLSAPVAAFVGGGIGQAA